MKAYFPLLVVIIFTFYSCDQSKFLGLTNDCVPQESTSLIALVVSNEVKIEQPVDLDGRLPNYTYGIFDNSEYIAFCGNGQAIQFFNMTRGKLERVVEPNKELPIINEIGNFYVHSLDSIFLFRDVPPKAFLINEYGNLINQWKLDGAPINWGNLSDYALYKSHSGFHFTDDKFYIALNTSMFFGIQNREGLRTQAIFDYNEDKWDTVYGVLPPVYSTNDKFDFVAAFTHPHRVFKGNEHIISYPQSHEIHKYDESGNLMGTYCASSQYISELEEPLLKGSAGDRQAGFLRFSAAPSYLGFFYHEELNIYTRLVRHKFAIEGTGGQLRSPCEIEYSLIVMNEQLQIIDETKLDGFLYDWRFAKATSNGFWVMPICDQWPGEEFMNYTTHLKIVL
jgi:hypothetical protein